MNVCLAALALVLTLQQPPSPPAVPEPKTTVAPDAKVELELANGEILERPLAALSLDDLEKSGAVFLRFQPPALPPSDILPEERAVAELSTGERWLGEVQGGKGDFLGFELNFGGTLQIEVDQLARLTFPARLSNDPAAAIEAPASGDRLYRRGEGNLDRVDGTLESFESEGLRFDSVLGMRTFAWREVAAILVDVEPPNAKRKDGDATQGPVAWIDLADGSRLHGRIARLDASGLELGRKSGTLQVPMRWIEEIALDDGRARQLSAIPPARADERSPFGDDLGLIWPHRIDRSVTGEPLVAEGRTWRRGIGVHAPSRLAWDLGGEWKELRGWVAIDDSVMRLPGHGSVRFRIHVDGKLAWESPIVRGGDPPLAFRGIALTGAKELVLEVDPADNLHVADRADWLRPVLLRGP